MAEALSPWSNIVSFTVVGEDWPTVEYGKIFPLELSGSEGFGQDVALNGDGTVALVGAPYDDTAGTNAGCVYVYTRVNDQWTKVFKLYAADAEANDLFGRSVAISSDGNHILVGASTEDTTNTDAGCVYYYSHSGTDWTTGWTQRQKFQSTGVAAGDLFGSSCALNADGSIALVGCPNKDTGGTDAGAVYYFTRAGYVWSQQSVLQASDVSASAKFGTSVALNDAGDYAAVGAIKTSAEAIYCFTRAVNVWTQQEKFTAQGSQIGSVFGYSVALNGVGDIMLVGTTGDDPIKNSVTYANAGGVYVFKKISSVWTQMAKLNASDPETTANFGTGVALDTSGNMALIGAALDDSRGSNSGAIYFFN